MANHVESQRGSKKKRLFLIRNSQRETVAASFSAHNPFVALDDGQVDIVPLAVARSVATLTLDRVDAGLRMEVGLSRGGTQFVEEFEADCLSNRADESDTDSFDLVPDVVSGVHKSPEPEEVVVIEAELHSDPWIRWICSSGGGV